MSGRKATLCGPMTVEWTRVSSIVKSGGIAFRVPGG